MSYQLPPSFRWSRCRSRSPSDARGITEIGAGQQTDDLEADVDGGEYCATGWGVAATTCLRAAF